MSSSAKVGETDLLKCCTTQANADASRSRTPPLPLHRPHFNPRAGTAPSGSTPQTSGKGTKMGGVGQIPDFPAVFQTSAELFYALSSKCQSSRITDPSNLSFPTVLHPPIPYPG